MTASPASFVAGPAALLAGWLLMRPLGTEAAHGPWWAAAHGVWLFGFVMLGLMVVRLWRMASPNPGWQRIAVPAATGLALLGVAANVAQQGFILFDRPAAAGFYPLELAAQLFFVALPALALLMAALRRVTPLSALLVAAGVVVVGVGMLGVNGATALVAVGMAVLWLGALLLGRGPIAA